MKPLACLVLVMAAVMGSSTARTDSIRVGPDPTGSNAVRLKPDPAEAADLVIRNAHIYTVDRTRPQAEAVAITGDRFIAVGSTKEIDALVTPATRVIDAEGATIVPGLQDAHGHVPGLGASLQTLDLQGTDSYEAILQRVAARARSAGSGEWIAGRGWDQNDWADPRWPDGRRLDAVAGGHPVVLTRVDGHALVASGEALRRAGVTASTQDPPGGRIIRDEAGNPTGVLIDNAQSLVYRRVPAPSARQVRDQILLADGALRRVGLTMVHDAGVSPEVIAEYRRLTAERRLTTRLYVMVRGDAADDWFARGPLIDPDHHLTVRAIKLVADGALGSRGAALLADYADEPGTRGLMVTSPQLLYSRTHAAAQAGFQTAIHAIGDRANREVLDVFERVERENPGARALRLRVEHAQVLDPVDIPRFAVLGVIASMQATHCTSDMPWAPARLGPARTAAGAYKWHTLLSHGTVLANGSDFPVEHPDPLRGFYAAITRQDASGKPPDGWAPQERLTREEALRSFTLSAAYAAHAERNLGSIAPGKLADLVVLSKDIMTVPPREILDARVLRTMVGGAFVYEAERP